MEVGLNMAEIELNVLIGQCLNRRIAEIEAMRNEVKAWESAKNGMKPGLTGSSLLKMPGSN